jgi:hypothetical protein
MASAVDICNLALAHLGDEATVSSIDPPEGSTQAEHCARFYPLARDALLEMHTWSFATKRVVLAQTGTPPDSWEFSYALPSACIRAVALLMPESLDDSDTQDYIIEIDDTGDSRIYTDVEVATLRYITQVTDTTKFNPLFVNALSWLLASYLAGPITKSADIKKATYQMFKVEGAAAMMADANAKKSVPYKDFTPGWITSRR